MFFWATVCVSVYVLLYLPYAWGIPPPIHLVIVWLYWAWIPPEWPWLCRVFGRFARWYYTIQCDPSNAPLDTADKQCIYGVHPHVHVTATTVIVLFAEHSHIKIVATSLLFYLPIWKDFAGLGGAIPATSKAMSDALLDGYSLAMHPDGLRALNGLDPERILAGGGVIRRPNPGFIRIARHTELPIYVVPVWSVHEHRYYETRTWWPRFQRYLLSKFYYPGLVLMWPLFPRRPPADDPSIVRFGGAIDVREKDVESMFYDALYALKG